MSFHNSIDIFFKMRLDYIFFPYQHRSQKSSPPKIKFVYQYIFHCKSNSWKILTRTKVFYCKFILFLQFELLSELFSYIFWTLFYLFNFYSIKFNVNINNKIWLNIYLLRKIKNFTTILTTQLTFNLAHFRTIVHAHIYGLL